jgi:hypothetical protein
MLNMEQRVVLQERVKILFVLQKELILQDSTKFVESFFL